MFPRRGTDRGHNKNTHHPDVNNCGINNATNQNSNKNSKDNINKNNSDEKPPPPVDKSESRCESKNDNKDDEKYTSDNEQSSTAEFEHIIVIGETGVGKSSLIKLLTGHQGIQVSDSSDPCTQHIRPYTLSKYKNTLIYDTQGAQDCCKFESGYNDSDTENTEAKESKNDCAEIEMSKYLKSNDKIIEFG